MSGDATVEVCDNCGSPLDLDFDGNCRWGHAHVQIGRLGRQRASLGPDSGLVSDGVDDCSSSAPFLYMLLSALGPGLSPEPLGRQSDPGSLPLVAAHNGGSLCVVSRLDGCEAPGREWVWLSRR